MSEEDTALVVYSIIIAIRYVWNITFLWFHPLIVVLGTLVWDSIDRTFFSFTDKTVDVYQLNDKAADLSFYVASLIYFAWFWKELWYAKFITIAMAYRIIGNILFLATQNQSFLFWFANVGEVYLWFYSGLDFGLPLPDIRLDRWLKERKWTNAIALTLLAVLKFGLEYRMWGGKGELSDIDLAPVCRSLYLCANFVLAPVIAFVVTATLHYWRTPHWEEGTVERKCGISVKKTPGEKLLSVAEARRKIAYKKNIQL